MVSVVIYVYVDYLIYIGTTPPPTSKNKHSPIKEHWYSYSILYTVGK